MHAGVGREKYLESYAIKNLLFSGKTEDKIFKFSLEAIPITEKQRWNSQLAELKMLPARFPAREIGSHATTIYAELHMYEKLMIK